MMKPSHRCTITQQQHAAFVLAGVGGTKLCLGSVVKGRDHSKLEAMSYQAPRLWHKQSSQCNFTSDANIILVVGRVERQRQRGSYGVLVSLIVCFSSQCVCGGDGLGQL